MTTPDKVCVAVRIGGKGFQVPAPPKARFWTVSNGDEKLRTLSTNPQNDLSVMSFEAHHLYDIEDSNEQVYEDLMKPKILDVLSSWNSLLVFAYGQSGTGKTYTMSGDVKSTGIIQRSVLEIFAAGSISDANVSIAALELYGGKIRDLLACSAAKQPHSSKYPSRAPTPVATRAPSRASASTGVTRSHQDNDLPMLQVARQINGQEVCPPVFAEITVRTVEEAVRVIAQAKSRRSAAKAGLNDTSSRSHGLVVLNIDRQPVVSAERKDHAERASLVFVDLAGSEPDSGGAKDRVQEGKDIRRSLLALTRCFDQMGKGEKPNYRESPLLFILQSHLTTSMIVWVATIHHNCPGDGRSKDESKATLDRTKDVGQVNIQLRVRLARLRKETTMVTPAAVTPRKDGFQTIPSSVHGGKGTVNALGVPKVWQRQLDTEKALEEERQAVQELSARIEVLSEERKSNAEEVRRLKTQLSDLAAVSDRFKDESTSLRAEFEQRGHDLEELRERNLLLIEDCSKMVDYIKQLEHRVKRRRTSNNEERPDQGDHLASKAATSQPCNPKDSHGQDYIGLNAGVGWIFPGEEELIERYNRRQT
ncbi:kinesin motor domain-domain-containing protein [Kockovaella imperatae]|uniref:Kinesin-like protein n=1 Tax=Kockovaella imperatae TaxID=4999 RepID=A0A1Y1U6Y9_9TREE|nr:kinesin motor domain-domain-containing protein [Kockovaella imperatae]ORX33286.1 kinesin motor domain-domain-containing protein [Kockovaella imperatae]